MVKILAIDIGFASTGMAVLCVHQDGRAELHDARCLHTKPEHKKRGIYVSHDDTRRGREITRGIWEYLMLNDCKGIVVELPSGGAQGAKANRAMGIATGVMAALPTIIKMPVEYITPAESRKAAIGACTAPAGQNIKELVIDAMAKKYGAALKQLPVKDREHIADALATFEAARERQLVQVLAGSAS